MLRKDNLLIEEVQSNEDKELLEINKNYKELSSKEKLEIVESIYDHLLKKVEVLSVELAKSIESITAEIEKLEI